MENAAIVLVSAGCAVLTPTLLRGQQGGLGVWVGVETLRKLILLDIAALPRLLSECFNGQELYNVRRRCGLQQIYAAFSYDGCVATYVFCAYTQRWIYFIPWLRRVAVQGVQRCICSRRPITSQFHFI